jgi:superfamily II DNA/RNA helicase
VRHAGLPDLGKPSGTARARPRLTEWAQLGKNGVIARLVKNYPDLTFIIGSQLHHAKKEIRYFFKEVDGSDRMNVLAKVLDDDFLEGGQGSSLVFCTRHSTVNQVSEFLSKEGYETIAYHGRLTTSEKSTVQRKVSSGEPVILVSTDALARGLDFPNITHVIMFDFPLTTVDFIHRAGRTARAGRKGKVTAFYLRHELDDGVSVEAQQLLAKIIQEKITTGEPFEKIFSRKRSLRSKFKKYGKSLLTNLNYPQG